MVALKATHEGRNMAGIVVTDGQKLGQKDVFLRAFIKRVMHNSRKYGENGRRAWGVIG